MMNDLLRRIMPQDGETDNATDERNHGHDIIEEESIEIGLSQDDKNSTSLYDISISTDNESSKKDHPPSSVEVEGLAKMKKENVRYGDNNATKQSVNSSTIEYLFKDAGIPLENAFRNAGISLESLLKENTAAKSIENLLDNVTIPLDELPPFLTRKKNTERSSLANDVKKNQEQKDTETKSVPKSNVNNDTNNSKQVEETINNTVAAIDESRNSSDMSEPNEDFDPYDLASLEARFLAAEEKAKKAAKTAAAILRLGGDYDDAIQTATSILSQDDFGEETSDDDFLFSDNMSKPKANNYKTHDSDSYKDPFKTTDSRAIHTKKEITKSAAKPLSHSWIKPEKALHSVDHQPPENKSQFTTHTSKKTDKDSRKSPQTSKASPKKMKNHRSKAAEIVGFVIESIEKDTDESLQKTADKKIDGDKYSALKTTQQEIDNVAKFRQFDAKKHSKTESSDKLKSSTNHTQGDKSVDSSQAKSSSKETRAALAATLILKSGGSFETATQTIGNILKNPYVHQTEEQTESKKVASRVSSNPSYEKERAQQLLENEYEERAMTTKATSAASLILCSGNTHESAVHAITRILQDETIKYPTPNDAVLANRSEDETADNSSVEIDPVLAFRSADTFELTNEENDENNVFDYAAADIDTSVPPSDMKFLKSIEDQPMESSVGVESNTSKPEISFAQSIASIFGKDPGQLGAFDRKIVIPSRESIMESSDKLVSSVSSILKLDERKICTSPEPQTSDEKETRIGSNSEMDDKETGLLNNQFILDSSDKLVNSVSSILNLGEKELCGHEPQTGTILISTSPEPDNDKTIPILNSPEVTSSQKEICETENVPTSIKPGPISIEAESETKENKSTDKTSETEVEVTLTGTFNKPIQEKIESGDKVKIQVNLSNEPTDKEEKREAVETESKLPGIASNEERCAHSVGFGIKEISTASRDDVPPAARPSPKKVLSKKTSGRAIATEAPKRRTSKKLKPGRSIRKLASALFGKSKSKKKEGNLAAAE